MFNTSLTPGDIISVRLWFGSISLVIKEKNGQLIACSKNEDVKLPTSRLCFSSKHRSRTSKWKYIGKSPEIEAQYIEFEEEE
tara:strand:+ start:114 stop:359 length:246 start_codon:yes stop_codon:yes gene_type:complete